MIPLLITQTSAPNMIPMLIYAIAIGGETCRRWLAGWLLSEKQLKAQERTALRSRTEFVKHQRTIDISQLYINIDF